MQGVIDDLKTHIASARAETVSLRQSNSVLAKQLYTARSEVTADREENSCLKKLYEKEVIRREAENSDAGKELADLQLRLSSALEVCKEQARVLDALKSTASAMGPLVAVDVALPGALHSPSSLPREGKPSHAHYEQAGRHVAPLRSPGDTPPRRKTRFSASILSNTSDVALLRAQNQPSSAIFSLSELNDSDARSPVAINGVLEPQSRHSVLSQHSQVASNVSLIEQVRADEPQNLHPQNPHHFSRALVANPAPVSASPALCSLSYELDNGGDLLGSCARSSEAVEHQASVPCDGGDYDYNAHIENEGDVCILSSATSPIVAAPVLSAHAVQVRKAPLRQAGLRKRGISMAVHPLPKGLVSPPFDPLACTHVTTPGQTPDTCASDSTEGLQGFRRKALAMPRSSALNIHRVAAPVGGKPPQKGLAAERGFQQRVLQLCKTNPVDAVSTATSRGGGIVGRGSDAEREFEDVVG